MERGCYTFFASDDGIRMMPVHPEAVGCATTFGTKENSKKQHLTIAGKDGDNQVCCGARAYIPNGQSWVFHLMFKYCLLKFWRLSITTQV
jgi:hypothetical protein